MGVEVVMVVPVEVGVEEGGGAGPGGAGGEDAQAAVSRGGHRTFGL